LFRSIDDITPDIKNMLRIFMRKTIIMKLDNSGIQTTRPFPHQTMKGLWLMPVYFKDFEATFFLGHNFSKKFLITDVKSFDSIEVGEDSYNPLFHLLIVIKQNKDQVPPDSVVQSEIYLYMPPFRKGKIEIGWQCSENWYTLVVKEDVLNILRGKEINESKYEILEELDKLFKRLSSKNK